MAKLSTHLLSASSVAHFETIWKCQATIWKTIRQIPSNPKLVGTPEDHIGSDTILNKKTLTTWNTICTSCSSSSSNKLMILCTPFIHQPTELQLSTAVAVTVYLRNVRLLPLDEDGRRSTSCNRKRQRVDPELQWKGGTLLVA